METSNKLFGLIDYDRLAIIMLFILFGLIIYKRMCRAKENFVSIDKDDISDGQVGKITSDIIDSYEDVVNAKDDNFKSYITLI